jgi:glycosyltransferase involved in cell wall biosynthesis
MQADITFAIPYYQNVEYLRIAVESVFAQTHERWHLLVCDDSGGDPEADALLRSYSDERVEYHRNPANLGMVANWNQCLERAPTDLVNLLHADDALLPRYAEVMLALARRHPEASAFFCRTEIIDARGRSRFSLADFVKGFLMPAARADGDMVLEGEEAVRRLMAGYFIMTPTLCYRRSRLGPARFRSEWKQVQDLEFMTRLLMDGRTVVGTRETAYAYRRHDASATSRQSESRLRFDEELRAFDLIAERAEALGWQAAARTARHKRIVKLHLLYRALRELAGLRLFAALETLRYLKSAG